MKATVKYLRDVETLVMDRWGGMHECEHEAGQEFVGEVKDCPPPFSDMIEVTTENGSKFQAEREDVEIVPMAAKTKTRAKTETKKGRTR